MRQKDGTEEEDESQHQKHVILCLFDCVVFAVWLCYFYCTGPIMNSFYFYHVCVGVSVRWGMCEYACAYVCMLRMDT